MFQAYSLHDREVGYCQGSGFIVGLLLMQMPEEEAFCVLVKLMLEYDMREMFKPSMAKLGLCMFQLECMVQVNKWQYLIYLLMVNLHVDHIGIENCFIIVPWSLVAFFFSSTLLSSFFEPPSWIMTSQSHREHDDPYKAMLFLDWRVLVQSWSHEYRQSCHPEQNLETWYVRSVNITVESTVDLVC